MPKQKSYGVYVPRAGTGNRAVLTVLYQAQKEGPLSRNELIDRCENSGLSNTSFGRPDDPSNYYTAWAGVNPLLIKKHGYVEKTKEKRGKFARDIVRFSYYKITRKGIEVYESKILGKQADASEEESDEIVLIVDNQELPRGDKEKADRRSKFLKQLEHLKNIDEEFNFREKQLTVGDFMWTVKTPEGKEVILDCVIERKRMDDLEGSVKDNRYGEQKKKMKRSGITNLVYLIENDRDEMKFVKGEDWRRLSIGELRSKINDTQIHDGFHVVRTRKPEETAIYLHAMTEHFRNLYKNAIFSEAQHSAGKIVGKKLPKMDGTLELLSFEQIKHNLSLSTEHTPSTQSQSSSPKKPNATKRDESEKMKQDFELFPVLAALLSVINGGEREIKTWDDLAKVLKGEERDLCKACCSGYEDEVNQKRLEKNEAILLAGTYERLLKLAEQNSSNE